MKTPENQININIRVIDDEQLPDWVKENTVWVETNCTPVIINNHQQKQQC